MLHGKICVRKSLGLLGAWNCLLLATLVLPPVLVGRIRLMNPKNPGLQSWGREWISGVSKGEECLAFLQYNLTSYLQGEGGLELGKSYPRLCGFMCRFEFECGILGWEFCLRGHRWSEHGDSGALLIVASGACLWGNFCIYGWVVGCLSFSEVFLESREWFCALELHRTAGNCASLVIEDASFAFRRKFTFEDRDRSIREFSQALRIN